MGKNDKTNVCRTLEQKKINYQMYNYENTGAVNGLEVANALGQNPNRVFKTLVTVGKSKEHYVFVVPVAKELNLKKAAAAVGEKNIEMIPQKELLPLTGYIHGGCSPIGMKKSFVTVFDKSVNDGETVIFSGGKIGFQVELAVKDIEKAIRYKAEEITD